MDRVLTCLLLVGFSLGLTPGPEIFLPEGTGTVQALATDLDWTYASTDSNDLVKVNVADVNDFGTAQLEGFESFYTIAIYPADDFLYLTAQASTGSNTGRNFLLRVNKTNLEIMDTHMFPVEQNIPFATTVDESNIYCGMYTNPGIVVKISKTTMQQVGAVQLESGENDIRSMEVSEHDPNHLYANTNTSPGQVVKIEVSTMTRVASTGPIQGANKFISGTTDEEFLYVGTNTNPASVAVIRREDMQVKKIASVTGCDAIAGMVSDMTTIYATCYGYPGSVAAIPKDSGLLNKPAVVTELDQQEPAAIVSIAEKVFIGTKTGIIQMSGLKQAVDCELHEWSDWSSCSATCNGGFQERTREIKTDSENGGAACPDRVTRLEHQVCNLDIICPEECHMGMVWVTNGTDVTRTCSSLEVQPTEFEKSKCECPPSRPIFHHSTCASASVCEAPMIPCQHTVCSLLNGRVAVHHHAHEEHDSFYCTHTKGRLGGCLCLCSN